MDMDGGARKNARYGAESTSQASACKTAGGSASPQGEARRECAGKAEQSECRAREDYGWGWAGGVTKPNHPTRLPSVHPAPAAAQHAPPTPAATPALVGFSRCGSQVAEMLDVLEGERVPVSAVSV